jgi:hypothetical protein
VPLTAIVLVHGEVGAVGARFQQDEVDLVFSWAWVAGWRVAAVDRGVEA